MCRYLQISRACTHLVIGRKFSFRMRSLRLLESPHWTMIVSSFFPLWLKRQMTAKLVFHLTIALTLGPSSASFIAISRNTVSKLEALESPHMQSPSSCHVSSTLYTSFQGSSGLPCLLNRGFLARFVPSFHCNPSASLIVPIPPL